MKNILLISTTVILYLACTKEDSNTRINNENTPPKKQLMGKWYSNNPSVWVREFTPTQMIVNPGGAIKKIVGLNDSIIYFENLGTYPGYTETPYKINGDTLRMGAGNGYLLRFKI